jgi:hypothetical protein
MYARIPIFWSAQRSHDRYASSPIGMGRGFSAAWAIAISKSVAQGHSRRRAERNSSVYISVFLERLSECRSTSRDTAIFCIAS